MSLPSSDASAGALSEEKAAVLAGTACYITWGLIPLLFMAAARTGATSWEIVAERAFWSVFWAGGLVLAAKQGPQALAVLRSPRTLLWLAASSMAIASNWAIFIWGVSHGHSLENSLGYYINPLLNIAIGAVVFQERISRVGWAAIGLATVGVALQTIALGHPPVLALALAATFSLYGVIRKKVAADAQTGLFIECMVMALPGLAYMVWAQRHGVGHLGASPLATTFLLLLGPLTVFPLACFSWAARRMPLSALAFVQFIGPTLQFVIGLATGEALTPLRALSFLFIWGGVAVFLWGAWRATRPEPA